MNSRYFLAGLAERVLELQRVHLSLAVIVPSRRAGLYLRQKFISTMIQQPVFAPMIFTMDEFMDAIAGTKSPEKAQLALTLYSAYVETVAEPMDFVRFMSNGLQYLADFNDLDNALVDANSFFRLIINDTEQIRDWQPEEDRADNSLQQTYFEFWENATEIYHNLQVRLDEIGGGYAGYNRRKAIEHLESGNELPFSYVLFAGFNVLTRVEEKLIDLLYGEGKAEVMWDMDHLYAGSEETLFKAGHFYRTYQQKWAPATLPNQILQHPIEVCSVESPSFTAQCDIAVEILNEIISEYSISDYASIAIVLCDESLLESLLLRLPANLSRYNVTMGKALNDFSVYHFFEKLIRLFEGYKNKAFTSESLLTLMGTVEMEKLDIDEIGLKIASIIRKNNIIKWNQYKTDLYANSGIWSKILNTHVEVKVVLQLALDIIQILRPEKDDIEASTNTEVLFEFYKLFTQLQDLSAAYPDVLDISALLYLFRSAAAQTKLPFEGEPISGIQIMGLLETRALDFEHIILLSANESILPPGKTSTTQIPHIFRKYFGLPTFEESDAIFAYSFYRLLHQAKTLHALYNGTGDDFGAKEMSRYLMQLESINHLPEVQQLTLTSRTYNYLMSNTEKYDYKIEKTPKIIQDIECYLEEKHLSASSINTLISSPIDFYMTYVLEVKDEEELEIDMESNTLGNIIHEALKELFKSYENKVLNKEIFAEINNSKKAVLKSAVQKIFKEGDINNGYNLLMYEIAEKLLDDTIAFERKRSEDHTIKISQLEETFYASFPFDYHNKRIDIRVKGILDRIQLVDDRIEIVDYKTGSREDKPMSIKLEEIGAKFGKDKVVQLVTYALLYSQSETGVGQLNSLDLALCFVKYSKNKMVYFSESNIPLNENTIEVYLNNLRAALTDLLNPEIPFVPGTDSRIKYSRFLDVWARSKEDKTK